MNLHSELIELFQNLSMEGLRLHFGVILILAFAFYLGARRKWVPVIATIVGSYAIFFVRTAEVFDDPMMTHVRILVLIVIGVILFGIYIYYLWIAAED